MELVALLIGAYFLGSVPVGVLVVRAHGKNIFEIGSGNIGATNVKRAIGTRGAVLVFLLDLLKGLAPALVARNLFPERQELWMAAGFAAVIGHTFSPFLKFKGGKGVSTALGMAIGSTPLVALIAFALFIVTLQVFRFVSLSSIIAVISTIPLCLALNQSPWVSVGYGFLTVYIIFKHRSNIARLRDGTESKFSWRSKPTDDDPGDGGQSLAVAVSPKPPSSAPGERKNLSSGDDLAS